MTGEKTLYRSRDDEMIGGVCAGIAEYFELDPTVIRLLAVLLLLVGNAAVLIAYVVLWVVVPEEPANAHEGGVIMTQDAGRGTSSQPGPDSPPPPPPPGVTHVPPAGPTGGAPLPQTTPPPVPGRPGRGPVWLGVGLIFVGVVLLAQMFIPQISLWQFWPVIIIVAGLIVVFRRGR